MAKGDADGVDGKRLTFLRESVYGMSIPDNEVDVVMSNAFLEHVPDVPRALAEIARITRPGGHSVHNIDMTDHRRYSMGHGPLDFLGKPHGEPIVHGCNRLRLSDFKAAFQRAGFTILSVHTALELEVGDAERARFAKPFCDASAEDLRVGMAVISAQRD